MSFGENLKAIRRSRGLSQEQLGKMVGLSQSAIGKYESGERIPRYMDASHIRKIESGQIKPNETTIERLASALDCTVGELFGEEPKVIYEPPKGRWEIFQLPMLGRAWTIQCSHCKAIGFHGMTPYCPECGAQMEIRKDKTDEQSKI